MSIINDDNKVKNNFWQTKTVGDAIEGTLISKRIVDNQLSGKEQVIYELKTADGSIWNVGGKPGIDNQMRNVKLGQIVGFKFIEQRKPSKPGLNGAKVVQVYANPSIVDEEWLKQQEEEGAAVEAGEQEAPVTAAEAGPVMVEEVLKQINNLAIEKLGATTAQDVKDKVMEYTKLAFIEANLPQILKILEETPKQ